MPNKLEISCGLEIFMIYDKFADDERYDVQGKEAVTSRYIQRVQKKRDNHPKSRFNIFSVHFD